LGCGTDAVGNRSETLVAKPNPCLSCGACCAYYRASFYWAEADDATPDGVPAQLTEHLWGLLRVMKGTNRPQPRCIALRGVVGHVAECSIYPVRASVCREFVPSWQEGQAEPRCDKARAAHGLPPLSPEDWAEPGGRVS
jgi:hypothetical protein